MRDGTTRLDEDVRLLAQRLFDMARNGDTPTLATYLDAGAPLDAQTASGNTLVMLAAYHGRATTLQMLLDRGAAPDTPNTHGQSPLSGAAFRGFVDICIAACWRTGPTRPTATLPDTRPPSMRQRSATRPWRLASAKRSWSQRPTSPDHRLSPARRRSRP
jgi:hypothetical protein